MGERVLTGDRPTGKLHLGHYVGSLRNRVRLQEEGYDCFILIADVQALTTHWDRQEELSRNVREVTLDYLAVGIDPERSTICIQSMIPEIHELTMYLSMLASVHQLFHNPTLKSEAQQLGINFALEGKKGRLELNYGFLGYPVSQAADITIFKAKLVPVGKDQVPHIEFCRKLVRKFNRLYGDGEEVLIEPIAMVGGAEAEPSPLERWYWSYRPPGLNLSLEEFLARYTELSLAEAAALFDEEATAEDSEAGFEKLAQGVAKLVAEHPIKSNLKEGELVQWAKEEIWRLRESGAQDTKGVLKGITGDEKMSKSLGNVINLADDYEQIWAVVRQGVTDPGRIHPTDPGRPDVCRVYAWHQVFNPEAEPTIRHECVHGLRGCVACKKELAAKLDKILAPIRERRREWEQRMDEVDEILIEGTRRAREVAKQTISEVREAMKINYFSPAKVAAD